MGGRDALATFGDRFARVEVNRRERVGARQPPGLARESVALFTALKFMIGLSVAPAAAAPPGFADIVERGIPAVVEVTVGQGGGTGFVISDAGHIVTNHHVIEGGREIAVRLASGRTYTALVVGSDPKTDIAVLRIDVEEPVESLRFGDSDRARVGDWVIAIGNPFGFGGSVSVGVISGRSRDIREGPYDDYIQTDAAINFGNSGGPLLNVEGEVIGVNTILFSPTGGSVGIGLAVPSAIVEEVVHQLIRFGETRRGYLGIEFVELTHGLAAGLGLDALSGAMITLVLEDSPAWRAGLEVDDVILAVGGVPIEDAQDLPRIIASAGVGAEVLIEVWRSPRRRQFRVTLSRLDE